MVHLLVLNKILEYFCFKWALFVSLRSLQNETKAHHVSPREFYISNIKMFPSCYITNVRKWTVPSKKWPKNGRILYPSEFDGRLLPALSKLDFHFLSKRMGYGCGDSFPFVFESNEIHFGSASKGSSGDLSQNCLVTTLRMCGTFSLYFTFTVLIVLDVFCLLNFGEPYFLCWFQ